MSDGSWKGLLPGGSGLLQGNGGYTLTGDQARRGHDQH